MLSANQNYENILKEDGITKEDAECKPCNNPLLDNIPRSENVNDDPGFWTYGEKIFCSSEAECEAVAEFLQDLFSVFSEIYDIGIDCGKDGHTGFYYISFD